MQKEMEEKRLKQEKDLWKSFEKEKRASESKKKVAEKMPKWDDGDQPEPYIQHCVETMKEYEVPENEWAARLWPLLSGKTSNLLFQGCSRRSQTRFSA